MKTNEGWDDMLKAAKAKSGPQPNGGSGVKQGTRYGGSKSKMDAPAPTKGPSVSQLRSLKKDMKKEDINQVEEAKTPSDSDLHKTLGPTKNMQQGIEALKKKHGMTDDQAKKHIRRLMGMKEEVATEMDEALVGNQHKLDKNKNGRLDKHDFKKLRGEEKDTVTMNPKMKSTKSSCETSNESVKSADKEAETYTDSKGKTKYRMVAKDKNMKVESKIRTSLKSVLENKQTAGAAVQPMNDSNTISGAGAKKMKKDHEPVIPKGGDEPALEKDNFDNATAGVNKSPMRPNDNAKGDKNIINPVSDITKKASKKEDDGFKQGGAPKLATSEGFIDKISQIYKNMFK